MQCAHKNLATSDLLLKSELLRLFYLLASTPGLCTEHTVSTESRMTETLRPVLTYIQKHHSESVTIEQLAKIAHMSSSYFMSCFKQNFGLGAIEYLNQVRIRSACDLLRNTDRSISDIAFDTGFAVRHQLLDQVGQRLEEERLEKFAEKACEEQRAYSGDRP